MSTPLRSRVLRGLAWKGASQIVLQLSRVGVALVLARLLAPEQFGVAAMVLVFTALALVLSDVALGAALVQRRELTEDDRSTVFWASLAVGSVCTGLTVALSGPVAAFFGEPEVQPLVAVLALSFVVSSLGTTQEALLLREMAWRRLELRLMAATAVGAFVGIAVALGGYGAWAIVWQQLGIAITSTVLLWVLAPWRPTLAFSRRSLRSLGGFSLNVFGQRLLYYVHRYADNLLVGRFLGPAALGSYALAYNVMLVPFSRIAGPVQDVLLPAFARMQDEPAKLAAAWIRATRLVATVSVPACVGIALVAPDFVRVVLGERWSAAVPVLQILAWVGLAQSLQTLNSNVLQSLDRTSTLFRFSIVFLCSHLAAFGVGVQFGIVGVAAGYALSSLVVEPLYAWLTARALGVSPLRLVRALGGVAQAALLMALAVLAVRVSLADAPAALRLAAAVAAGVAVYVPCVAWRAPEVLRELRSLRAAGVPA